MREELNLNELEQVAGGMANPDEEVYVTVSGDTLWGIAQKRRTTVDWLFNRNKEEIKKKDSTFPRSGEFNRLSPRVPYGRSPGAFFLSVRIAAESIGAAYTAG